MLKEFRENCPTCGQSVQLHYHCPVVEDYLVLAGHKAWSATERRFVTCPGSETTAAEEEAAHT